MSKKNRKHQRIDYPQAIRQLLQADFGCTEDEIELISYALKGMAPQDVVDHMYKIQNGEVSSPKRPTMILDMGDGTEQHLTLTDHPVILIHDYAVEKYGIAFGTLYWNALTDGSTKFFYETLRWLKRAPFFAEDRAKLKARSAPSSNESEGEA